MTITIPSFFRRLLGAGLCALAAGAGAQTYPARTVDLYVGFAAGGSADIMARLVADKLSKAWGRQVVVQNKPGAGGTIAAAIVAHAPADGYSLLLVTSGHAGSGALYPKLPFDPSKSFVPVIKLGASPVVVVVRAQSPFHTLGDVIAAARRAPGKLSYAAGGGGATVTSLAAEYFKDEARLDLLQIPYSGSAPGLMGLLAGDVDLAFDIPSSTLAQIKAGQMRALAVTSSSAAAVLPGVPTVAAQGLPGFEVLGWFGILAPAGTPPAIVERLNRDIGALLAEADVKERLATLGVEPGGGTPQAFGSLIESDTMRAGAAIRRMGLKAN